jgi:integrase
LRVAAKAGLPGDVTPHVLRHSFASIAADLDYSELTIAALIGHRKGSATSRYAHHADAVLLAAADAVANRIAELMGDARPAGVVVQLRGSGGNA